MVGVVGSSPIAPTNNRGLKCCSELVRRRLVVKRIGVAFVLLLSEKVRLSRTFFLPLQSATFR